MPGSLSPASGLVQNANSTWLNGQPFQRDLEAHLGRPVRLANDANCFALSEAVDGAGAGARSVFGVILGTGCGGGLVFNGELIDGPRGIGGEWGHNPAALGDGRRASRPALLVRTQRLHGDLGVGPRPGGRSCSGSTGDAVTERGDRRPRRRTAMRDAQATLDRHAGRLARGLAHVVNIFDPARDRAGRRPFQLAHLYEVLPDLMAPYVFAERARSRSSRRAGAMPAACAAPRGCGDPDVIPAEASAESRTQGDRIPACSWLLGPG